VSDTNHPATHTQQARILDAARRLFLDHGYNAAKLRDIARAADVSMGGIYHHFESKQQIYEALYKQTDVAADLFKILSLFQATEFPENLGAIGDAIAKTIRTHRDTFKLFYIDVLEFKGENVKPLIQAFRAQFNTHAEALLARRRDDLIDVHPAILMRVMVDLFLHTHLEEAMLEISGTEGLGLSPEEVTRQTAKVLLLGVMKRP